MNFSEDIFRELETMCSTCKSFSAEELSGTICTKEGSKSEWPISDFSEASKNIISLLCAYNMYGLLLISRLKIEFIFFCYG